MKRILLTLCAALVVAMPAHAAKSATPVAKSATPAAKPAPAPKHAWSVNATVIEGCSCPMFCPTFFGGHPTAHHDETTHAVAQFCRFNDAIKVNEGHYYDVSLDGARFWIAGDLGADPGQGGKWAVVTFDRSLTERQKEAITQIVAKLYPIQFQSMTTDEADVSWVLGPEAAHALINNGRTAEVALQKASFGQGGKAPVIKDLRFRGASGNSGFVLMPNSVEAYRSGAHPFEYKGTSGFVLTFDIYGDDPAPAVGAKTGE
jgi:hypothetical protein